MKDTLLNSLDENSVKQVQQAGDLIVQGNYRRAAQIYEALGRQARKLEIFKYFHHQAVVCSHVADIMPLYM